MNDWLDAGLDAGGVVSHWIHAGLSRVDFDHLFEFNLASLQLSGPVFALGFAELEQFRLGVLGSCELGLNEVWLCD